jgi:subtilase family serine protease
MRKKSTSLQSRYRANVQLEMLEQRQLLSGAVLATTKFTVAPRPTAAPASTVYTPNYQVLSTASGPVLSLLAGGYSPSVIRTVYGLSQISFGTVTGDGTGQTIAIIDAYNDPNIQSDAASFDATFGLPAINLSVVNQTGGSDLPEVDPAGPGATGSWESEESLDVEWAHALAPGAKIILVEASDDSDGLTTAAAWAAKQPSVSVVSMSFGGDESSQDLTDDSTYITPAGHQGVTFLASTGDNGAPGGYPAFSPNVVAVGGTTLTADVYANYDGETGWSGSGGGISTEEAQPSYQTGVVTQSTTQRTIPDISFDADPNTGVPVFDSYDYGAATPWAQFGGTSFAAPAWAAMIAIADQGRAIAGEGTLNGVTQTLPLLYAAPSSDFHDITTGSNGFSAGAGYDLVTGLGSPEANLLVPYLVSGTAASGNGPTVTGILASGTTVTAGTAVTLTAQGVSDPGATGETVRIYQESNGIAGLQTGAGGDTLLTSLSNGSVSTTVDTTSLSGTLTYYAQVTDASGAATATGASAPSVSVNVAAATSGSGPVISSFTAPASVISGNTLTLQVPVSHLSDSNGTVRRVTYYEETNGIPGLQTGAGGDLAFTAVSASTNYALALDTSGMFGVKTFYALAVDSNNNSSADGTSAPSVSVTILQNAVPSAPTTLTATTLTTTSVQLNFQEGNSGQIGFKIERALDPTFTTFTTLYTINRPNVSSYTDTGLSPGTRYFYRVTAFNKVGDGAFSPTAQSTTLFTPAKLGFGQQPLNMQAGAAPRTIVVDVETPSGGISTIDNSNVTLSIGTGPTGATLGGTLTVQAVNGVATFSNVTLTEAGKYTLLASDAGLVTKSSAAFTVSAQASSAHLVLVQQPTTLTVGVKESPAYVVKLEDQYGNVETAAKSKVTLSVADGPSFTPKGTLTASLVKGVGTLKNVILNAAGNYVLHLTDSTFGSIAAADVTVGIATTTIVTPKPKSVKVGHPLTLTVQLKSNAPSSVPFSGIVTLTSNGVTLGTAIVSASGVAKFVLVNLAAGSYPTTVSYDGDLSHTAAESSLFTLSVTGVQPA